MPVNQKKQFRIAMIPGSSDGVNYYRLAAWAFEMRKYRHTLVDLLWFKYETDGLGPHPWQKDFKSQGASYDMPGLTIGDYIRRCIERACQLADVVVWHPVWYPYLLEFFLELQHKYQKPFVVETDDNYLDVPPWNEAFQGFQQGSDFRRVAIDCLRNADALIVTTPHLKETYSRFNSDIAIVPNSLDFRGDSKFIGWDKVSPRKHKGLRIGWIGGRCHFDDLMSVAPVLRQILIENPHVKLVLVNSALEKSCEAMGKPFPFEGFKNVLVADRSVAINRYAPFMASYGFDIGIAPLVDCNFNRSKSILRWIEYAALGIPSVCQGIGDFLDKLHHGRDALLANTPEEWERSIKSLIQLPQLRHDLGRAAAKRVRKDFNVKRNAAAYIRELKRIADFNPQSDDETEAVWTGQTSMPLLAV